MLCFRRVSALLTLFVAFGLAAVQPAAAQGTIDGGYAGDDISLVLHNTSSLPFTNIQFSATSLGVTNVYTALPTLAAGTSSAPFAPDFFGNDPDDSSGPGSAEYPVVFTALNGTTPITATFSPSTNASGGIVDFEGVINDNDFAPTFVANIGPVSGTPLPPAPTPGAVVPEPAPTTTFALGAFALLALAAIRRKRTA